MRLSLNGPWTLLGTPDRTIIVPGCWEGTGIAKDQPGPFIYERRLSVPAEMAGRQLWLRFEGVSYYATVTIDQQEVGQHVGLWDAFEFEVTPFLTPGTLATLRVEVEKPASLTQGPDSATVPGRFAMRETLAGFLPYVWGHLFGGIWQDVWLEARNQPKPERAHIRADASGSFAAEVTFAQATDCTLEILSPDDRMLACLSGAGCDITLNGHLDGVVCWSPDTPVLYQARLYVRSALVHEWKFGFRTLEARGTTLCLNDRPIYPRMALSWGWYLESLHSNPGRDQVRADLLRLKAFGYNGVKLCLWVPPAYYFELADELGLLLWLELPMWLPKTTPFFVKQTPQEYARIVHQVRQHPSLIIYSLGCELSREVDAEILEPLYQQTKALIGDVLLRDNSGSGEAYGGLLNEFADYYDYHFYSDLQFFTQLVDYFTPRWRPVQPWVFGEFCDLDTFRDLEQLKQCVDSSARWWLSADPDTNPQGARWQYDVPFQQQRLQRLGLGERANELKRISEKQALLHRKFTLELVRTYHEISGYVVTGERDTPISTAGMWDDCGRNKFSPSSFKAFNDDIVLLLGWDKRRSWIRGGDRAAYWDTFSYTSGTRVRPHIIASNYSAADGPCRLNWALTDATDQLMASGKADVTVSAGDVCEVCVAEFDMPVVTQPQQLILQAELTNSHQLNNNYWPLWAFPPVPWSDLAPVSLIDPQAKLTGLDRLMRITPTLDLSQLLITTQWDKATDTFVRGGGRAIVLLSNLGTSTPCPLVEAPFWREAVKIIEPHPAWSDFPHNGWTNLQFYGLATDLALDTQNVPHHLPLLRRLDARTMALHDYATEASLGNGRMIVSTLRFMGGLGNQPTDITRQTAAQYLLSLWVGYFQKGETR